MLLLLLLLLFVCCEACTRTNSCLPVLPSSPPFSIFLSLLPFAPSQTFPPSCFLPLQNDACFGLNSNNFLLASFPSAITDNAPSFVTDGVPAWLAKLSSPVERVQDMISVVAAESPVFQKISESVGGPTCFEDFYLVASMLWGCAILTLTALVLRKTIRRRGGGAHRRPRRAPGVEGGEERRARRAQVQLAQQQQAQQHLVQQQQAQQQAQQLAPQQAQVGQGADHHPHQD